MGETPELLRVGLTGGIASGKTTVGHILAEHGALVLDADLLSHEVIQPGWPAHEQIVARFGREILDAEGAIDRSLLGRRVFHDRTERTALESIVHPQVMAEVERRIDSYEGHSPVAVFDAALLVETGGYRRFHKLIVLRCTEETQVRRLLARDGMTADEAHIRIRAQAPLEQKLAVADYVVDTEGTLRETHRQVDEVYASLLGDFEERFGPPG